MSTAMLEKSEMHISVMAHTTQDRMRNPSEESTNSRPRPHAPVSSRDATETCRVEPLHLPSGSETGDGRVVFPPSRFKIAG